MEQRENKGEEESERGERLRGDLRRGVAASLLQSLMGQTETTKQMCSDSDSYLPTTARANKQASWNGVMSQEKIMAHILKTYRAPIKTISQGHREDSLGFPIQGAEVI